VAESTKYDLFLEELNTLEKQIYYFMQKSSEVLEANQALNNRIILLERENDALKKRINEIEGKLSKSLLLNEENLFGADSLNLEEREALKSKISELIARIDYHLRS
jgi:hypothetical protein